MGARQAHVSLAARISLLALAALPTACGAHHYGSSGPKFFIENEPNDFVGEANWIGDLRPGRHFVIDGFSEYGFDPADGFAFWVDRPSEIEVILTMHDPVSNLDLCVFEPDQGQYVFCFDGFGNPESGYFEVFDADFEMHLVVEPEFGASAYTLEVIAYELSGDSVPGGPEDSKGSIEQRFRFGDAPSPAALTRNGAELDSDRGHRYAGSEGSAALSEEAELPLGSLILFGEGDRVERIDFSAPASALRKLDSDGDLEQD